MLILIITTIILLFLIRKRFPIHKILINRTLIFLSLWLVIGLTLRHFLSDPPPQHYTDIEMAQTFIKDNPILCKRAKTRIMDDGTIKIVLRKGKPLYLKDGVVTSKK
jgi:hypothetical protein